MGERPPLLRLVRRVGLGAVAVVVAAGALVLLPLLLLGSLSADAVHRDRLAFTRMLLVLVLYAEVEAFAAIAAAVSWVGWRLHRRDPERIQRATFWIERVIVSALWRWVVRLYRLFVEVEGEDCVREGPFILLSRHASTADVLLPVVLVAVPHGLRPRYVLKAELAADPVIDVLGHRAPSAFVHRGARDPAPEIAEVAKLGNDLGSNDFVAIFPEGTRFTAEKRQAAIELARRTGNTAARRRAEALRETLPPHSGGVLALLKAAPEADVVFCAHTGFEGITHIEDLMSGALLDRAIRVHFERFERSEVPTDDTEARAWLFDRWREVDGWVGQHRHG